MVLFPSLTRLFSSFLPESDDEEDCDQIVVYVGKERTPFTLLRKQLQPILSHIEFEDYKHHHLPDVNRKTFRIFEHWLQKKTLDELDPAAEDKAKETMLQYLELYFKATEWEIHDLANDIMDCFRERYQCEHGYFPAFLIKKIYDNTLPGAPLRRYIVDNFLYKSAGWPSDELQVSFAHQVEKGNTDFLFDCYQAALALAKKRLPDPCLSIWDSDCKYHVHEQGKMCGSLLARERRDVVSLLERAKKRRKLGQMTS